MINGHVKETHDITDFEALEVVPMLLKGLELRRSDSPATTSIISAGLSRYVNRKVAGARIRKMITFLQNRFRNDCKTIITHGNGYWISSNADEIKVNIDSLKQRRNALDYKIKCLESTFKNCRNRDAVSAQTKLF